MLIVQTSKRGTIRTEVKTDETELTSAKRMATYEKIREFKIVAMSTREKEKAIAEALEHFWMI